MIDNNEDQRSQHIELTAADLTIEERLSLTSGDGPWTTPAVPRVGLASIKMTDGSNGARGDSFHGSTSVCFPSGSSVGATWNTELAYELATLLAKECRRKQSDVLLGPTINLHRYPLAGRNFECYGEDPFHAGALARSVVRGLQDGGVAAVPKHLVVNDSEIERESVDVRVSERPLREVYLLPFEMAVRDGGAWAVMSAYNKLNGTHCSANRRLLSGILKDEWGFDGVVISDWGGVDSSVDAANAGLDIEMPGPPDYFGYHLKEHVHDGTVAEATVSDKANRVINLARRVGAFNRAPGEESSVDDPADRELVRQAAVEGMVLLSNDGTLPLDRSKLGRLAVVGPKAALTAIQGGGSSLVNPAHEVNVLDGIRAAAGAGIDVLHAEGGSISRFAPVLTSSVLTDVGGRPGATLEYFRGGELVRTETVSKLELTWIGAPLADIPMADTSVRVTADLVIPSTGEYTFGMVSAGHAVATIDEESILDSNDAEGGGPHFFGRGSAEVLSSLHLEAGRSYRLVVDLGTRTEKSATAGVILGMHPPQGADPIKEAVALAHDADAAIVVVGTGGEYEMEGGDRPSMGLPGQQAELVERIIACNPRTIVLVNAGAAVDLTPANGAAAQMFIGYAGQEIGAAVGDILFGDADPGGRLPFSIPRRIEDAVELGYEGEGGAGWSGAGGSFAYADEGRIGYRHHEYSDVPALYPFGHGLTYGSVDITDVHMRQDSEGALVTAELVNSGIRPGTVVVQIYLKPVGSDEPRKLVAFAKHVVAAGDKVPVEIPVEPRSFRRWSTSAGEWERVTGPCRIDVAFSSSNTAVSRELNVD